MGSLQNLKIASEEVRLPDGQSFTVRGLGLHDASELLRNHGEELNNVYDDQIIGQDELPDVQKVAQTLMRVAPLAVIQIIAMAADDDTLEGLEAARRLPAPVHIDALIKIAQLTFHSEEQLKKLIEAITLGSGTLTQILQNLGNNEPPTA